MEAFLMEKANMKQVVLPVDLNTAAVTGARVSMKGCKRVAFLVDMGDSTGATVQCTLRQHDAATAGNSKDLSVANPYYKKAGTATKFTKVEPTAAAAMFDISADFAAQEGLAVFEVLEEDLDVNNGFAWVSMDIADSGAAKLASVLAVLVGPDLLPAYSQDI